VRFLSVNQVLEEPENTARRHAPLERLCLCNSRALRMSIDALATALTITY
jgi:hypothetical protein